MKTTPLVFLNRSRAYHIIVLFATQPLEQGGYKKRKPRSEREEELLGLVREAIHTCKVNGQPITRMRLSGMVGVERAPLLHYPRVKALVTQAVNEDKQQRQELRSQAREEELTRQVVATLQQLRDQKRRITKRAIEKAVHVSNICSHSPQIRVLIESAIQAQHTTTESA